jgi:NAD(P)-dependent dehydrogenase (short-subunit alcohol dehydrogenase family)
MDRSLAVNVKATANLIAMIEPLLSMTKDSQALFFDDPRAGEKFFGYYGASKAAQMALVRSWQAETRKSGPNVRILTPAPMATAVRARFFPGEARERLSATQAEAARIMQALS